MFDLAKIGKLRICFALCARVPCLASCQVEEEEEEEEEEEGIRYLEDPH